MFLNESGVAILFRLINFAALIALVFYVCKKYVIKTVKEQIAHKQDVVVDLRNQADTLVDDICFIDQATQQDAQMCQDLKVRVLEWRAQAERVAQESLTKKQAQIESLVGHARIQTAYLQRRNAYESILPQVIDQTRKKLEQKFENEVLAQDFMAQLIASMQKGE